MLLQNEAGRSTDWDSYYTSVPPTARLTRRYTTRILSWAIQTYAVPPARGRLTVVEIGGANSCFLDELFRIFQPRSYEVVDTNEYGLSLLASRWPTRDVVRLRRESVLNLTSRPDADLVFSVGLVEHFNPADTRKAILAHFDLLREGGTAIITFPTPTLLYRATRRLIEMLGMWKFPDERPLLPREVISAVQERATLVHQRTLWPLMLTQHLVVARKAGGRTEEEAR